MTDNPRKRFLIHGRSLGRSQSWCGRDALRTARSLITTVSDPAEVECRVCRRVYLACGELTKPLRLPDPRVIAAPKRGAA